MHQPFAPVAAAGYEIFAPGEELPDPKPGDFILTHGRAWTSRLIRLVRGCGFAGTIGDIPTGIMLRSSWGQTERSSRLWEPARSSGTSPSIGERSTTSSGCWPRTTIGNRRFGSGSGL
jgi:hypothetical protein